MNRPRLTYYVDANGLWRWRFQAANGRIVADSGQGYKTRENAEKGWAAIDRACFAGDGYDEVRS